MSHHLSPTNVATYYHNQCQLYLRNAYSQPKHAGKTSKKASPLAAAQFQRGLGWEARVFSFLETSEELIRLPLDSELSGKEIEELFLKTGLSLYENAVKYIANLAFKSPSFEKDLLQYGSQPQSVAFGVAKPDLIKLSRNESNHIVWEVIDAKASNALKSSHNAQVGFYHLCLENLLLAAEASGSRSQRIVASNQVGIWLPSKDEEDRMSALVKTPVSLLLPPLRTFLFKTLPQMLGGSREDVKWHLNPSCQGCEFIENCTKATVKDGRMGMIPNLSMSDAHFIREVLDISVNQGLISASRRHTDIEDLDLLIKSPGMDKLEKKYAATAKRFQRILGVQKSRSYRQSSLLDAARSHQPQLTKKRVFTFPRLEDIAIYLSVIINVDDGTIGGFCISVKPHIDQATHHVTGTANEFVPRMAYILHDVQGRLPQARTQVYTYSPTERGAIMSHLIKAALATEPADSLSDDIRLCLGALCEGASLLLTSFQPLILSGALLHFLSKKNTLPKKSLQICCERLNLSTEGTVEALRKRIETEQKRLAELGGRAGDELHRREVGQLGKVVVLKREVERLVSLPIPGFVDLPSTARALLTDKLPCETDDAIFAAWSQPENTRVWEAALRDRNRCMAAVIANVRKRIADIGMTNQLLLNEAKILEVGMMDICRSPKLRKLMFMLQFEVVLRLQALWQDRLDGCPNAPLLRFVGAEKKGTTWYNIFDIISGTVEPPVEDRAFYDWLLAAEPDESSSQSTIPPEIYFDDLAVCGMFFPLTRYTRPRWDEQHPAVKSNVFIANITDIRMSVSGSEEGKKPLSQAIMQTFYTGKTLQKGCLYRISQRLVDFNLNRVLQNLVTMDFQDIASEQPVPFIELITTLHAFAESPSFCGELEERNEKQIVRGLGELGKLGVRDATALVLIGSQRRACMRMLLKRLSVIWGPPGTGKTYTLALSTLRMIEVLGPRAIKFCPIILVTAMTHAAITAIVGKINTLMQHYRALKGRDSSWLDAISLQRVLSGATHQAPTANKIYIYAGTTFQLYKFCEKAKLQANLIIIDEAGQLALGTAALVLRWLSSTGKVVLAGDHQQLAPILGAEYPESDELPLFGSVLDLMMGRKHSGLKVAETMPNSQEQSQEEDYEGAVVQLLENFRLNEDLGSFVELIYAKKFKPMKPHTAEIAESLQLWLDTEASDDSIMEQSRLFLLNLAEVMAQKKGHSSNLTPPKFGATLTIAPKGQTRPTSLALIRVRASKSSIIPYESHVRAEAKLAAALVHWIRESFGAEETIFVACPHRIQRSAVKQAILSPGQDWSQDAVEDAGPETDVDALAAELAAFHVSESGLRIDTVERLQGSEATFVIFLLSHTHTPSLSNHLEFLLSRRRLNVGISRAKSLCIVISSRGVLQPSLEVLAKDGTREGLEFLRAYEERAWIGDVDLGL